MTHYDIATIDGDGIGPEVCQSAITVPHDLGGSASCTGMTEAICRALR